MSRFTDDNERLAREIVARYPRPKSATIPLCHLAQERQQAGEDIFRREAAVFEPLPQKTQKVHHAFAAAS